MTVRYVYDKDEIKQMLPIQYAGAQVGVIFDREGKALCPFHDDHNPSLAVMAPGEDGQPWWLCRACGANGDVLGLVQRMEKLAFFQTLTRCSDMIEEMPDDYVPPPQPTQKERYVVGPEWEDRLHEFDAFTREHASSGLLSYAYGITDDDTPPEHRARWDHHLINWGVRLDESCNVVIPHRAKGGRLTAVKVKYRDGAWRAFGSFPELYGSWRRTMFRDTILTEGESDSWWSDANGLELNVFGLPAGALWIMESAVERILGFKGKVYLGFDNDESGRDATKRWGDALIKRKPEVLPLANDEDLRGRGEPLAQLIERAQPYTPEDES